MRKGNFGKFHKLYFVEYIVLRQAVDYLLFLLCKSSFNYRHLVVSMHYGDLTMYPDNKDTQAIADFVFAESPCTN